MLFEHHMQMLQASGISEDVIQKRGYKTLGFDDYRTLYEAGFDTRTHPKQGQHGLLIPINCFCDRTPSQWRPDFETPLEAKYLHPIGAKNHLDVHWLNWTKVQDDSEPLVITEGVKKGDCLTSRGHVVISLSGVWNWKGKDGPLSEWDSVTLDGRKVYVMFDSDGVKNSNVNMAISELTKFLSSQGATVIAKFNPSTYEGKATKGIDDYIVAGGSFEEAVENGADPVMVDKSYVDQAHLAHTCAQEALKGTYCFTDSTKWMRYDGKRWGECGEAPPLESIRQYVTKQAEKYAIIAVRSGSQDDEKRAKAWKSNLTGSALTNILKLCRGIDPIFQQFEDFDSNVDMLNVQNGLLNLTNGTLEPHNFTQLVTKICNVDYIPGAAHSDWDKALEALPEDVHEWAQLHYGHAVSGRIEDNPIVLIEHGGGSNGKSTVVDAISSALGDYYRLVSSKILLSSSKESMPTEFMDLKGLRFAQLEETPESRRLDVNKMKQAVGNQISARPLYSASVTFDTTHSLFIATNNIPIVNETDEGSWRRLALLKYPYTFRANPEDVRTSRDKLGEIGLKARIKNDPKVKQAVLAWLVEGAFKWYAQGCTDIKLPERVKKDTHEWRASSDLVMRFYDDCLEFDAESSISTRDLFNLHNSWLDMNGHRTLSIEAMLLKFMNHDLFVRANCSTSRLSTSKITSRPHGFPPIEGKQAKAITGVKFKSES